MFNDVRPCSRDDQSMSSGQMAGELHKLAKGLPDMPTHLTSNLVVTRRLMLMFGFSSHNIHALLHI